MGKYSTDKQKSFVNLSALGDLVARRGLHPIISNKGYPMMIGLGSAVGNSSLSVGYSIFITEAKNKKSFVNLSALETSWRDAGRKSLWQESGPSVKKR